MFAPKFNENKLKTNLRICVTRLKNLYKKKNELNVRSRRELAEYLKTKKIDRARIRVEQIVREDYLLEVLEIIELYCDLLITRLGLVTSTIECDPGLKEAIATIIWVAPRLSYDCQELAIIQQQFALKYGREFALFCANNTNHEVNPKVMQKMNVKAPPPNLCEAYLVEIARSYDVEFTPDEGLLHTGEMFDIGAPPELPQFDLLTQNFLDIDKQFPGDSTPYPINPDFVMDGTPTLPSIGESNNGPMQPPPYLHDNSSVPHTKTIDKDDYFDEKKDPNSPNPSPPPNDDDDFDALSSRFNNLRTKK